jgi:hypothetical protein
MKTKELTGVALDWAVAQAWYGTEYDMSLPLFDDGLTFQPSALWQHGGPIIEREVIDVFRNYEERCWQAEANRYGGCPMARGEAPLIAAMRCFVASRLGDEVNIPEELIS